MLAWLLVIAFVALLWGSLAIVGKILKTIWRDVPKLSGKMAQSKLVRSMVRRAERANLENDNNPEAKKRYGYFALPIVLAIYSVIWVAVKWLFNIDLIEQFNKLLEIAKR
jgi:hypothetical protein